MDEKVGETLGEVASKVIESTGHAMKDSTADINDIFHGILGGVGGTIQWCIIFSIKLVLIYVNRSMLLKLCQNKISKSAGQITTPSTNALISTTTPLPMSFTSSHPRLEGSDNPRSTLEQSRVLPGQFHSARCYYLTKEVWRVHTNNKMFVLKCSYSCSALFDASSLVLLLCEKLQCQVNLTATPFDSHGGLLVTV